MLKEINFDNIRIINPCIDYIDSYRIAIEEHRRNKVIDFAYPKVRTKRQITAFFKKLDRFSRGTDIPGGYVPTTSFWLVDGYNYLGSGDIRHYLTDNLRKLGGNIGYSIRPAAWRCGLGTIQLSMLLNEAKKLRIQKPIVTCFNENIASAKIIEKNGGVLIKKICNRFDGEDRLTRIYEIDLTHIFNYDMMSKSLE